MYHVFAKVKNLDVGDVKPCQRLDLVLCEIHLVEFGKVAESLQVSDLVPPQLQLLELGMPAKGLNLLDLVLNQTQLR